MLEFIRRQLGQKDRRLLLENVFSLSLLQLADYVLPLVSLPFLVRVLGPDRYGLVVFVQAFTIYFRLLINFGFDLSATREIAMAGEDVREASKIFFSVIFIKAALFLFSLFLFTSIVFSFERFHAESPLFFLTFSVLIGVVIFPEWFFLGKQQMRYVTILNVGAKAFFTVMIFVFIRSGEDYLLVPLFNSLGYVTAGIMGMYLAVRKNRLSFIMVSGRELLGRIRYSSQFFASRISTSLFTSTNTFIIGLFLGSTAVAYYAAAEKIYNALVMMARPIADSLYPHMAKSRNIALFRKVFITVCLGNCAGWILVLGLSNFIIALLFGEQYGPSATILRILAVAGIFNIPSILLGFPFLGALGHERIANYSVIAASLVHFALLIASIPILNIYLVAGLVICTQVLLLCLRIYGLMKVRPQLQ
jgi:PST family polysaccharide transporter